MENLYIYMLITETIITEIKVLFYYEIAQKSLPSLDSEVRRAVDFFFKKPKFKFYTLTIVLLKSLY